MSTGQETGHYVQNENQKFSGHPQSLNFSKKGSSSHQSFGKKTPIEKVKSIQDLNTCFENVSIVFVSFDWVHDLSQLKIQASITPYTLRGHVRCLSLKIVSRQSTVLGSSHRMSKLLFSEDNLWGLLHLTNFDHGPISASSPTAAGC